MIVKGKSDISGRFTLEFQTEADDKSVLLDGVTMSRNTASFWMPRLWTVSSVHPDLLALAALLCANAFVGQTLRLSHGVSPEFHDTVLKNLGIDISPVDGGLSARRVDHGHVPGLSFAGDIDSLAALEVLPRDAVAVFVDRLGPEGGGNRSLYRSDSARSACAALRDRGYRTIMISTDLEYLRTPVGVDTSFGMSVPLILLADFLALDSLSLATTAESAYRIGHSKFSEYYQREAVATWVAVFEAAGLPIMNPLIGVSEIGSTQIVRQRGWEGVAQACDRGSSQTACMNCWKCFKSWLLHAALNDEWPSHDVLDQLFRIPEATRRLGEIPIPFENVLVFIMQRYQGAHPDMIALKRRVCSGETDVDYLRRWYAPSARPWISKYRETVAQALDEALGRMSAIDEDKFRSWDTSDLKSAKIHLLSRAYQQVLVTTRKLESTPSSNYSLGPDVGVTRARVSDAQSRARSLQRQLEAARSERDRVVSSSSFRVGRFFSRTYNGA